MELLQDKMGNEILIVSILGLILGFGVGYIVFIKLKLTKKIINKQVEKIIKDPHKLKELLDSNGICIDDGKEILFKVEKNKEGKDELVQETKEIIQKKLKVPEIKQKITKIKNKKSKTTKIKKKQKK